MEHRLLSASGLTPNRGLPVGALESGRSVSSWPGAAIFVLRLCRSRNFPVRVIQPREIGQWQGLLDELPQQAEDYVHRIGRTGRAGEAGEAYSLVSPEELPQLAAIEKFIKKPREKIGRAHV